MRRSGAPSKYAIDIKRRKLDEFHCPYSSVTIASESNEFEEERPDTEIPPIHQSPITLITEVNGRHKSASTQSCLSPIPSAPCNDNDSSKNRRIGHKFRPPLMQINNTPCSNLGDTVNPTKDARRYFSVMWCKASRKKHKIWEGDAVLVTMGRTALLYDMDNKEISRGSGYKCGDLEKLAEDETLAIGGKEIQVMSVISEENYKNGSCFLDSSKPVASTDSPTDTRNGNTAVSKPFVMPQKSASISQQQGPVNSAATPRLLYDPQRPGALVMPRPSQVHQWAYNKGALPVVDVVVDPHISRHLRPHQRDGVVFLYECLLRLRELNGCGAILADEMGLGKTLQAIALLWTLLKQGPYGGKPVLRRALIVTPGSLVKNWKQEFKKWLGPERLSVFAVGQDCSIKDFSDVHPVLIVSYEMYMRHSDVINATKFDAVVCDEGHRLKNAQIKTTSTLMGLACRRRLVLTGTPIQNDLHEFFSIIDFVNPGILGSSATFTKLFSDPIVASRQPGASEDEQELGEARATELARLTKLFILRRTQDVNLSYLPPKRDLVVFCRPSSLQLRLYDHLLSNPLTRTCLGGVPDGAAHLICISALKKLCNHPSLLHDAAVNAASSGRHDDAGEMSLYHDLLAQFPHDFHATRQNVDWSGKLIVLSHLLGHLRHMNEKVILVSNHTKTLDLLQNLCLARGYGYLRLDGQTPTAKRLDIVQQFNSKYSTQIAVLLLSSKAGGVGLNLVGASRLILYDIDWNPATDLQAMARVWRDGQTRLVHVYRLITTSTIEEKIFQRQVSKQAISGAVIDIKANTDSHFSREELKDLFSINATTDCETHDLLKCDCKVTGYTRMDEGQVGRVDEVRACQLGAPPVPKKRGATMDELLDWKHTSSTSDLPQECCLSSDNISYVFWNDTQGRNNPSLC